ncbi:hypothetical protein BC938DRAFT_476118 [Jimgerdemannia flammicorona]|uniref:Uncharacterized protein n=1 Tax=Jimgerdemannia flammicorona TaxID=994334 RepID=A0A433PKD8_9FUNG|nr:hypothetical protein BC938DRAFT_476118 [Jimgerdemannia flammicorona]
MGFSLVFIWGAKAVYTSACRLEIGSAYALQVALLQIPAMTAFSAWCNWNKVEEARFTFT